MKTKFFLYTVLIISILASACVPKKPLPPVLQPTAPPKAEFIDYDKVFLEAEDLYKQVLLDDALLKYGFYLKNQPDGIHADKVLKRIGDIQSQREAFSSATDAYMMLLEKHPNSPLANDTRIALLELYDRQEMYEDVIRFSFDIPDVQLSKKQLLRKQVLLGDAYLAMNSPMDAFYFYSLVYDQTAGPLQEQSLHRLKEVLPHLNVINTIYMLDRLKDGTLRGYLLYHLALLNLETGRTEDALIALSEIIKTYPTHEQAEQAKSLVKEIFSESITSPHTIGCMLPLSGPYKTYGFKALQGIELALNEYHATNGDNPIYIIVKDTASDSFKAVQAVKELDDSNASVIIGPIISAEPAALEAQSRGIPIITFTQKEDITQIGQFVFRNFITPRMQTKALAEYTVRQMGLNRIAILFPDENYGRTYMNLFWDEVLSLGGNIVGAESYASLDTDFASSIKKLVGLYYQVPPDLEIKFTFSPQEPEEIDPLKQESVDMFDYLPEELKLISELYFWGIPKELGPLAEESDRGRKREKELEPIVDFKALFIPDAAKKVGLIIPQLAYYDIENVVLIGTNLWHSQQLINMSREYIHDAILTDGFSLESQEPRIKDFSLRYQNSFDEKPGFIEAVAYDSARIVLQLLRNPRIRFKSHLKDEMLSLVDFPGVTGSTSFNYRGDAIRSPFILRVKGREFETLQNPL